MTSKHVQNLSVIYRRTFAVVHGAFFGVAAMVELLMLSVIPPIDYRVRPGYDSSCQVWFVSIYSRGNLGMAQSQSESFVVQGGKVIPNLFQKDLVKQAIIQKTKPKAQHDPSLSVLSRVSRVPGTSPQGGKKHMKTADTAGDGIIATAASAGVATVVKPSTPNAVADATGKQRILLRAQIARMPFNKPGCISSNEVVIDATPPACENDMIVCEKPKLSVSSTAEARLKRIEAGFAEAKIQAAAFDNQRMQRQSERDINEILSGRKRFADSAQTEAALESARMKKAAADAALKADGPPRYAQSLKKLHYCTVAIEDYLKAETCATTRDAVLKDCMKRLEDLMSPIDNIWNGIPGKTPDLLRPGIRAQGERPIWTEERLAQIKEHLYAKINTVDGAQAQRICVVKDNPTIKEILRLHEAGELPKDGSIIFFTADNVLLYQCELKVSQRSTQSRAKDAASAERHANNTPAFIDVSRLDRGLGPEGAGLWRFIGQETRIVGAAVLRPVFKDGKPVELPGARNGRGEPMVKKEVAMVICDVPAEVTVNMAYGHLLNTIKSKKIARDKKLTSITNDESGSSCAPDLVSQLSDDLARTGA